MIYRILTPIKGLLFIASAAVLVGVFFFSTFEDVKENLDVPQGLGESSHEVFGLNLYLQDNQQGTLRLKSAYAFSKDHQPNHLDLEKPQATLKGKAGDLTELSADHGLYTSQSHTLVLTGHVHFKNSKGYNLETEKATIDTSTGHVFGDTPIWGTGPFGSIRAGGFELLESGKKIILKKNSRLGLKLP